MKMADETRGVKVGEKRKSVIEERSKLAVQEARLIVQYKAKTSDKKTAGKDESQKYGNRRGKKRSSANSYRRFNDTWASNKRG